jgi:aminomethyltransferase
MLSKGTMRLAAGTLRQPRPIKTPHHIAPATWQLLRYPPRNELPSASKRTYASPPASKLKRTALYQLHIDAGAKIVPFGGYDMPLEYKAQSHAESHNWTREKASLFDVSHMVQHMISGGLAEQFLMKIMPSSIDKLGPHTSTLSCLLHDPSGGIVDDTVITRLGPDAFYFVTNAGCRDDDLKFISEERTKFLDDAGATDDKVDWRTLDQHSLLALQGPLAAEVLQRSVFVDEDDKDVDTDLSTLYFGSSRYLQLVLSDQTTTPPLLVSRTGYTGEDGFEISIPAKHGDDSGLATMIAKTLAADGQTVRWAGLAARDSLRLEAGMCLYGHDIGLDTTPPVAALGWVVGKERRSQDTAGFNGAKPILEQLAEPKKMPQRRVGFLVEKGPAAREGAEIVDPESGEAIGRVTSGLPSPTLAGQNIAMGLVRNGWHKKGTKVGIRVRKNVRKAEVARMPFVENKFYRPDSKGKS